MTSFHKHEHTHVTKRGKITHEHGHHHVDDDEEFDREYSEYQHPFLLVWGDGHHHDPREHD